VNVSRIPLTNRLIARTPFYYGWVILGAGTLGLMMTLPGRTAAISVVLDPIITELGLSRGLVSALFMAGTLLGSLTMTFFGRAFDRWGTRKGVMVTVAVFALACVGMGQVSGPFTLFLGFFALRSLGQGALWLVSQVAINQWFVARRGFALGLAGVGLAFANAAFPIGIQAMTAAFGWRGAYALLGGLLLAVMLPVGALLFAGPPEAYGLAPDGRAAEASRPAEVHWSLSRAVLTPTFWVFALGIFTLAALSTALVFHHYSIMAENGLARFAATGFFVPFAAFTAIASLTAGILLDRINPFKLLIGALGVQAAALALVGHVKSQPMLWGYGALLGLAAGLTSALAATVWSYYYGRRNLGAIKGLAQTIFAVGTAVGPLPFALAYDGLHAYQPATQVGLALSLGLLAATAGFVVLKSRALPGG
jgi:MFS family permease